MTDTSRRLPAGRVLRALAVLAAVAGCATTAPGPAPALVPPSPPAAVAMTAMRDPTPPPAASTGSFRIPVEYYRLANGLRVVLSRDSSAPTVTVAVHYRIGWRLEPRGRTGFAHLFEHLMFQESTNLDRGEADRIVEGNGGLANGQTHTDYTNYFEVVPSHALEPVLWVEAERLRGLAVSEASLRNQQDVVKNEVRVNVLNRPYGGFGWLDVPQYANVNWHNAHNFYGELADIDAATLADARTFYDTYYVPRNAVLVVAGDFDPARVRDWIGRYFGPLADRPEPVRPDVSEPRQTEPRVAHATDRLAPRPGLAFAYHVPPRNTREWYAFGLLNVILLGGEDSRLWRQLVTEKGYTDSLSGGINFGGSQFDYDGPTLWTATLLHDASTTPQTIVASIDEVLADLYVHPVTKAEFERALTKIRSSLYDVAGDPRRTGLTTLLGSFALFDDDPERLNGLEAEFRKVTPEDLATTAREYLRPGNRTLFFLEAGAGQKAAR